MTRHVTVAWRKRNVLRKIVTHRNCGPRGTLTAAGIMMPRHARVEWRRENFVRKDCTTDKVDREARRAWMLRRRLRSRQENSKRIRDLGSRYIGGKGGQPRTALEGGAQDNYHTWEAKERSTRNYMRFLEGGSQNKLSELPADCEK
jgi:hypothetical protein